VSQTKPADSSRSTFHRPLNWRRAKPNQLDFSYSLFLNPLLAIASAAATFFKIKLTLASPFNTVHQHEAGIFEAVEYKPIPGVTGITKGTE
jgi:hypothetical protein